MIIKRVWAMPNKWTFQIPPIADLVKRYVKDGKGWIDPFAGMTSPAEFTNDIQIDRPTRYHMDALEFLKGLQISSPGILFDPPYSYEQYIRSYKMHAGTAGITEYLGLCKAEISRLIKPGGIAITFGWNSCGCGENNGFNLEELLIVCHGACHNDTIVTVERKIQAGF